MSKSDPQNGHTHTDVLGWGRLGLKERERVRTSSSHFHVAEAHPGNDIAQEGRRGRGSGAAFADGGAGCTEPQWTLMDSLIHLMDSYGFVGFYCDLMGCHGDLVGFHGNWVAFYCDLVGFHDDLVGFNGDLVGDLMGFHGDLYTGSSWGLINKK